MRKCSFCNKVKDIVIRNPATCRKCYKRPTAICLVCKKNKRIEKRVEKGIICSNCYKTPKDNCSVCEEIKSVYKRNPILCNRCYQKQIKRPIKKCYYCKEIKEIWYKLKGFSTCRNCYNKQYVLHKEICSRCKINKEVFSRKTGQPLCKVCNNYWRCENDQHFYIKELLRKRLKEAFKMFSAKGKIRKSRDYNINYKNIIEYLGECPGKRGDYHIDHIFPLYAFDFDNPIHIRAAFAPENHQWLSKEDNLKKSSKYDPEKFKEYLGRFYEL